MGRIRYKGRFESYDDLPTTELPDNAIVYKEADSIEEVAKIGTLIGLIPAALGILAVLLKRDFDVMQIYYDGTDCIFIGIMAQLLTLVPHEFIHGWMFPKGAEVEFYQAFRKGALFVTGTAPMSKGRFIAMSLAPNIIFGVIPLLIYIFFPITGFTRVMASLGTVSLLASGGDLYNVYNTIRQVPDGAHVVMSGLHTYWYC